MHNLTPCKSLTNLTGSNLDFRANPDNPDTRGRTRSKNLSSFLFSQGFGEGARSRARIRFVRGAPR
jgi:hypothetical protein